MCDSLNDLYYDSFLNILVYLRMGVETGFEYLDTYYPKSSLPILYIDKKYLMENETNVFDFMTLGTPDYVNMEDFKL